MTSGRNAFVGPGPGGLTCKRPRRLRLRIHLNLRAKPAGCKNAAVRINGVAGDFASKVCSPALNSSTVCIDPVKPPLSVNILSLRGAKADLKKNMLAIIRPVDVVFHRLIVGQLAGRTFG